MVFGSVFGYWAFFGCVYLLWLTVQDFRNNMRVDDRRNWFMMGLSVSLLSHVDVDLLRSPVRIFSYSSGVWKFQVLSFFIRYLILALIWLLFFVLVLSLLRIV